MRAIVCHPLQALAVGRRRVVFVPLLALTIGLMGVLGVADGWLRTEAAPQGIVSFELAGDAGTAQRILDSWDGHARVVVGFVQGLDTLFLLAYSTTIALGCVWAADVLRAAAPGLAALGPGVAWGQWVAAGLDAVENAALLVMLFGGVAAPWPRVAWGCAVPKFGLIGAGLLYALVGAIVRLARR